ncbi:Outer envelope protein 80, chloroplastic [Tetrabaena socialis]|uniref:Outer envelope protein 80, chloroplastic n=1 Tax=Tetrabaena socialis TaxID=47790 RepID=A0A2J7ZVU7_9CHLO|nr:Outer envelope protein 80, chloroplastic [Tetrabaena socialis]|eukprot:PNH04392.1 Outer envelope protein 80, chloroplastic [Tetrabaena socialis]
MNGDLFGPLRSLIQLASNFQLEGWASASDRQPAGGQWGRGGRRTTSRADPPGSAVRPGVGAGRPPQLWRCGPPMLAAINLPSLGRAGASATPPASGSEPKAAADSAAGPKGGKSAPEDRILISEVSDYSFEGGTLQLQLSEAVVKSVALRFLDAASGAPKDKTRTRPHIITRHLTTKPGQVYNLRAIRRDINAVYSTGLFEDVNVSTREADDSTEAAPKASGVAGGGAEGRRVRSGAVAS